MNKEELATERNEVREILEGFSEELSQDNLNELSRVFCLINGDEKRIADLEKACDETQKLLDKQIEATYKLDKENAELKLKLEALEGQTPWKDIKDKSEVIGNLTKAKKLLKQFLEAKNGEDTYKAEWEAEQFLSEVEK